MAIPGVGYLIANDILSDVSYALIQNPGIAMWLFST